MESFQPKKTGRLRSFVKKAVIGAVAIGAFLGYGSCRYHAGVREGAAPTTALEEMTMHPTAKGFLEYPGMYSIDARVNQHGAVETYLTNARTGAEVPMPDATERLLATYQQHPGSMEFAIKVADTLPGGK